MRNNAKVYLIVAIISAAVAMGAIFFAFKNNSKMPAEDTYIVSFNCDGGSFVQASLVGKEGLAVKPADPTKEGFIFDGWYLNESEYDFETKLDKSIVLIAHWSLPPVPKFTVTFDSDGGTGVSNQIIESGSKVSKPTTPKKEGLEFVTWKLNGVNYDFATPVTKDITLKATWQKPDTRLTVTFDSSGGSSVSAKKVEPGSKVTKPTNPTKSGYTFVEWRLNGVAYNFQTVVSKNIELKAVWRAKPVTYTYSVKWQIVSNSVIGEYKMFVLRNDGQKVSGKIKVTYKEGGSDTFNVSTSGYQIVKAIVGSASVVSPTS